MKSYTDLEQTKKLAEILPFESADMIYRPIMDIESMSNVGFLDTPECYPFDEYSKVSSIKPLPCWSLAALLSVLPDYTLQTNSDGTVFLVCDSKKPMISDAYNNPVDACVEIVLKLHELKML